MCVWGGGGVAFYAGLSLTRRILTREVVSWEINTVLKKKARGSFKRRQY